MKPTASLSSRNWSFLVRSAVFLLLLIIVPLFSLQVFAVYQAYQSAQAAQKTELQNQARLAGVQLDLYLDGVQRAVWLTSQTPGLPVYLSNPLEQEAAASARTSLGVLLASLPYTRRICLATGYGTCLITSDASWQNVDPKFVAPSNPQAMLVRASPAGQEPQSFQVSHWVLDGSTPFAILILEVDIQALQNILPEAAPGTAYTLREGSRVLFNSGVGESSDEEVRAEVPLRSAPWQIEARSTTTDPADLLVDALRSSGFAPSLLSLLAALFTAGLVLRLDRRLRLLTRGEILEEKAGMEDPDPEESLNASDQPAGLEPSPGENDRPD